MKPISLKLAREIRATNVDQVTLRAMMDGNQEFLVRLREAVDAESENCIECPECGDGGPHEDNGERGSYLSWACAACGAHFDAEES